MSRRNLLAENVRPERITVTGNTVIDALYMVENKIKGDKRWMRSWRTSCLKPVMMWPDLSEDAD